MTDRSAVHAPSEARVLVKRNVKRSVWSERANNGPATILKVFHARGASSLLDGMRARRERRALDRALAAALPVPRPVGLERSRGRPALRLEEVEDAISLEERLESGGPGRRTLIAKRAGALFARMEAAEFTHADPHLGNVLLDPGGAPWLIDLARARFQSGGGAMLDQAAAWCASLRERDPRFLALAARAWRRARPAQAVGLDDGMIERRAREMRADSASRRVRVWRRESTRTAIESRPVDGGGAQRVAVVRERLSAPAPPRCDPWSSGWKDKSFSGDRGEIEAAWNTLVRAFEHRLPAALPRAVALDGPWFIEFTGPDPAEEVIEPDARLRGLLKDRRLRAIGPLVSDRVGATFIGPSTRLSFEGSTR